MTDTYRGLIDRPEWMFDAECAGIDPDILFPVTAAGERAAVAICQRCDVQAECLAYALTLDEQHGVWGGLTTYQRRRILRGRPAGPIRARGEGSLAELGAAP